MYMIVNVSLKKGWAIFSGLVFHFDNYHFVSLVLVDLLFWCVPVLASEALDEYVHAVHDDDDLVAEVLGGFDDMCEYGYMVWLLRYLTYT